MDDYNAFAQALRLSESSARLKATANSTLIHFIANA